MKKELVVGTRGSALAIIQAGIVADRLRKNSPGIDIEILKIATTGDRDQMTSLDRIGINVFVKELEEALLDGRIDVAVHSLKDVPTHIVSGLNLTAVLEREDPADVLVANAPLDKLPAGSRVGTGSLRRSIQLALLRPDIEACPIRGNVDTRLRKASDGEVSGVVIAAAAMSRMGWQERITQRLSTSEFLPAAGQGAIVIEARSGEVEVREIVARVNHLPTWQCVTAERAFLGELGGGCRAPIAALATVDGDRIRLEGMVASPVSRRVLRDSIEGGAAASEALGVELARRMLGAGAAEFIHEAKRDEIG